MLSVSVSVLVYGPVRSGSVAPIDCLKSIGVAPLDTGPAQVTRVVGAALPPTGA